MIILAAPRTLLLITFGLMVTSAGEGKSHFYGFLMQALADLSSV